MKGKHWYDYQPSPNSSWAWRQICQVKERIKGGYIGDKWLGKDIEHKLTDGYDWMRQGNSPKVEWYNTVWNNMNLPKHRFIAWLIKHKRLLTLDRLCRMGITIQKLCFLCGEHDEDHEHLFFHCKYTCLCFNMLYKWIHLQPRQMGSPEEMMGLRKISRFRRKVLCSLVIATQYHIWHARNVGRIEHKVLHPMAIVKAVQEGGESVLLHKRQDNLAAVAINWCRMIGLM
ncbi:uncharacterized protein LOC141601803 [Silene latifolia]|uniref:uncharacterized protein LOC141601803 n=1 Tax=Silene latifolia TaxID=37657 RepID=UPI003D77ABF8